MKKRVAIIGGGMTGLAAAYYLAKHPNFQVSLYERNPGFGGLLGILEVNGVGLEGYYHHLFKRDLEIIGLVKELGLQDKLLYLPSKIGIYYQDKIYPFSSPRDLLNFTPLALLDRLRLGLVVLYLQKLINEDNWQKLQAIPASAWMRKYCGKRAYKIIWQPLLEGKFGKKANSVSMAWLWSRIYLRSQSRNKVRGNEELVYLAGGFKILVDRLVQNIKNLGGTLYVNTQIKQVAPLSNGKIEIAFINNPLKRKAFHKVVVTIPNPIFVQLTPVLSPELQRKLLKIKYRGAMVTVLLLKKPFMQDIYWLNIHKRSLHLLAVVEHTNFVSPSAYGGFHILYAGNYHAQDDPLLTMDNKQLLKLITTDLKQINPAFDTNWIEKSWIFRDRFAQPIVTTDYHTYIPAVETGIPHLYLVNMAQVYPEDRGTNQAVRDGRKIAEKLIAEDSNS